MFRWLILLLLGFIPLFSGIISLWLSWKKNYIHKTCTPGFQGNIMSTTSSALHFPLPLSWPWCSFWCQIYSISMWITQIPSLVTRYIQCVSSYIFAKQRINPPTTLPHIYFRINSKHIICLPYIQYIFFHVFCFNDCFCVYFFWINLLTVKPVFKWGRKRSWNKIKSS